MKLHLFLTVSGEGAGGKRRHKFSHNCVKYSQGENSHNGRFGGACIAGGD